MPLWLFAALVLGFFTFMFVMLFGDMRCFRGTFVHGLHLSLTTRLPRMLSSILGKLFPKKLVKSCSRFKDYCLFQKNPFVQIFYLGIVLGVSLVHVFYLRFYIPSLSIPVFHSITYPTAILASFLSFLLVSYADPGFVDPHDMKRFEYYPRDFYMYGEKKMCPVCHIMRPPRVKHCRLCNRCVVRFDHHCAWLNNCVGAGNYRWFLSFLGINGGTCVYTAMLCYRALRDVVVRDRLMQMVFRDPATGQYISMSFGLLMRVLLYKHLAVIMLGLFTAVLAIVVFMFLGYHVTLLVRNITTNETFKMSDAKDERQFARALAEGKIPPNFEMSKLSSETRAHLKQCLAEPLINIYNRGVFRNIWETMFPLHLRRAPVVLDFPAQRQREAAVARYHEEVKKRQSTAGIEKKPSPTADLSKQKRKKVPARQ